MDSKCCSRCGGRLLVGRDEFSQYRRCPLCGVYYDLTRPRRPPSWVCEYNQATHDPPRVTGRNN